MDQEVMPVQPSDRPTTKPVEITPEQVEEMRRILREEKMEKYENAIVRGIYDIDAGRIFNWEKVYQIEEMKDPAQAENSPYPRFCSVFGRVCREVMKLEAWPGARLDAKALQGKKKVELVVHPLYGALRDHVDPLLWKQAKGDIEKYLGLRLSRAVRVIEETLERDPDSLPSMYFFVLDAVEEIEAMRASPAPGSLRVYVMPNRSFLSPERREAMSAMIRTFGPKDVVIDSVHDGEGSLQEKDIKIFADHLKQGANIEIQGGYLEGCMEDCSQSFKKMGRDDIDPVIDHLPSTASQSLNDNWRHIYRDAPKMVPPKNVTSLKDVIAWVHANDAFNTLHNRARLKRFKEQNPTVKVRDEVAR